MQTSKISILGIIINDTSDHFAVFAIIKRKIYEKHKQNEIVIQLFSLRNIDNFNNLLTSTDFETVFKERCSDAAYNGFMDHYLKAYDKHFHLNMLKYGIICETITLDDEETDQIINI
jgi:hypothetical protein